MSLCHQHAEYDNRSTKTGCRTNNDAYSALRKISAQKTFICRKFVRMLNILTPSPLYLQVNCPQALEDRYALQISKYLRYHHCNIYPLVTYNPGLPYMCRNQRVTLRNIRFFPVGHPLQHTCIFQDVMLLISLDRPIST